MKIPKNVSYIIKTLEDSGFEAYAVGGCVRDYLLLKTPSDWDITTSALPEETKKLFAHTYDTGIRHGTITVLIGKESYEVTTYRIDGSYNDFRRPSTVTFTKKITEDLSRRDFTMNAIAYNDKNGFVDPFNGINDIKSGIIKGVGEPDKRFNEDALRMLRCIRFSAQLGFNIEKNTYSSVLKNSHLIKNISAERIRDELTKLLLSDNPEKITELKNTDLLKEILPEINEKIYNGCQKAKILKKLSEEKNASVSIFYSVLLSDLPEKQASLIMKKLKFDSITERETALLVKHIKEPIETSKFYIRKKISKTNVDFYKKLLIMRKAIFYDNSEDLKLIKSAENMLYEIISDNDCCSLKDLKIKGNTLKSLGITEGKAIGKTLEACLDEVLKNPALNTEQKLKEIALQKN